MQQSPQCFLQAEEFVTSVSKDGLQSVVQQAARGSPQSTLCLMIDSLEHYLTLRQRREFQVQFQNPTLTLKAFLHFHEELVPRILPRYLS